MNKYIFVCISLFILSVDKINAQSSPATKAVYNPWGIYRGVNINSFVTKSDLEDLALYGADIVRINFSGNSLVNKKEPYDFNEDAFKKLEFIINECEQLKMKVIIDPHTSPGFATDYTTTGKDVFWTDTVWHAHLTKLWMRIAKTYKDRGRVIAGYDILNEPGVPANFPTTPEADWNQIFAKLIKVIRAEGDRHTIILNTAIGRGDNGKFIDRLDAINKIVLPADKNIVISPHMYLPHSFTHQGAQERPISGPYPGTFDGVYWDKSRLEIKLKVITDFQKTHPGIPILIGEFSASRPCGPSGDQYVKDLIEIFEKHKWSWAYHSYRQNALWDPELSNTDLNNNVRSANTYRMKLLESYFKMQ